VKNKTDYTGQLQILIEKVLTEMQHQYREQKFMPAHYLGWCRHFNKMWWG